MRSERLRTEVRLLFSVALVVFILGVIIGMINGQRRVVLPHSVVLTHVHSGTLGWITLSVLAFALVLFGQGPLTSVESQLARWISLLASVSIPLYVLAFWAGVPWAEVALGTLVLAMIVAFLGWLGMRSAQIQLGVAHVAVILALATLTFGATVGVLLQVQAATKRILFPGDTNIVHPAAMVAGFLLLVGMAVAESRLLPPIQGLSRAGVAQVVLPFLSAVVLVLAILLNLLSLNPLSLLLEVAAVVVFIARFHRSIRAVRWLEQGSERHFAASAVFIVAYVALYVYVVALLIAGVFKTFGDIPQPMLTALDHVMFIGVMSNALFGMIQEATSDRRAFWPVTEDILFWGMNAGLVGFVVALLAHTTTPFTPILEGISTSVMGACILVALVAYFVRLQLTASRIQALLRTTRK
jgi:hypothetical protein